ncbi:MAG: hypothetical protein CVU87_05135 [Firmicutes bacterium HGW-Firmicutes-12]|jgi:murein DD-endopeptidase MepM/ murein hydrolase activator NlpD|nr:MAG: hypothetical protein CVU87_05135 [Firmicutes bacterium HGW-Firmicutes-12]
MKLTKSRIALFITVIVLIIAAIPSLTSIAEGLQKEIAYQFMVDGENWAIVSEKASLEDLLDEYQKQYSKSIDINAKIKNTYFQQKVEIIEVEVMPEAIEPLATARQKIYAAEHEEVSIEVQSGDNLWNIAKAHDLTVSDIEMFNPEVDPDKIFPGDILVVKPLDPVLDVIIEMENTIVESIPFKIDYQKDNNLYKNQKKIVKEGIEGEKEVTYDIALLNGYQHTLEVQNEKILTEPENAIVQIGTKTTVSRGGNINYGVVSGKRISSAYGTRYHPITGRKTYHDGVDIAANSGNGVYAYTDGKVIEAGWNGGYGNCILIDHGNGLKTRYAHLSSIYVKVGQRVEAGTRIGAVGSTGFSTGPHLHFEVIKNGQTKNPLNYI